MVKLPLSLSGFSVLDIHNTFCHFGKHHISSLCRRVDQQVQQGLINGLVGFSSHQ